MFDADGGEDVVVFFERQPNGQERERALRGIIIGQGSQFLYLQRRDGEFSIALSRVVKIEKRRRA